VSLRSLTFAGVVCNSANLTLRLLTLCAIVRARGLRGVSFWRGSQAAKEQKEQREG
jgi:hypothetical protein